MSSSLMETPEATRLLVAASEPHAVAMTQEKAGSADERSPRADA